MLNLNLGHKFRQYVQQEYPACPLLSTLFLRLLGVIYFSAFASASVQIVGLIGSDGILPVEAFLTRLSKLGTITAYWQLPTVFWFQSSNYALISVCSLGMISALMIFLNIFTRLALLSCFILYLSIVNVGQTFFLFQWDSFLLEVGILAIGLSYGSAVFVFLYRFLIARFMFMGGVVKIASGDPAWSDLTALNYHYLTQPLPTPLAFYVYQLPEWFHKFSVAGVLFIELLVPFFVFLPGGFRKFAGLCFIMLQSAILITGNYNFFNLLALLLCLMLFTDRDIYRIFPWAAKIQVPKPIVSYRVTWFSGLYAAYVFIVCAAYFWLFHSGQYPVEPIKSLLQSASRFSLVNQYGPFAVMTRTRPEIVIQGSMDGKHWRDYHFNYKPVRLDQPLRWNIPHQPRLDWQMWFAAMSPAQRNRWFLQLMERLKQSSPAVLALLQSNPFPGLPPKYVRASLYRYEFNSPEKRAKTGEIWNRIYLGRYY